MSKRQRPSWMAKPDIPTSRVFTNDVMDQVNYLHNLREELDEIDEEEIAQESSLEEQVSRVVYAANLPFYNDVEQVYVKETLRASAASVTGSVLLLLDEKTSRYSISRARRDIYQDIMQAAIELSQ